MIEREDRTLAQIVDRAIAAGVLPAGATCPKLESRPWPVVVLTGLGAWLAAIPFLVLLGLVLGDWLMRGIGPYFVGGAVLTGAVVVLRAKKAPLFIEQLAVPGLLVGGGSLGVGLFRDFSARGGAAALALVALGVALVIVRSWLRVLFGILAAGLVGFALLPQIAWDSSREAVAFWWVLHALLAIWLASLWAQFSALRDGARASSAAAVESIGAGWAFAVLLGLALFSGMTFLVGGTVGGGLAGEVANELNAHRMRSVLPKITQVASVALTALACGWAARQWRGLRTGANVVVAGVLAALAWWMPTLGGILLAVSVLATTFRFPLAVVGGVAAVWTVGAFYYQLQWPLATKAAVLAGCGLVLGLVAWVSRDPGPDSTRERTPSSASLSSASVPMGWLFGVGAVAALAIVNFSIWQKETLIATGRPVYVELAPVDPRSLMQGDFMRLNFRLPLDVRDEDESLLKWGRPRVVGRRDVRGVADLMRLYREGSTLAADEFLMELTPKNGRWVLVTDAWFFKEGQGKKWEAAKYGEFRVGADGRALLVGMADVELRAIRP